MKRIKIIMTISLVILFAPSHAQVKDKDAMVRKIFTVLQQKDKEGFVKLFPDAATSKKILVKIMAGQRNEELEEILNSITDSSMQQEFRETFLEIIKKGEEKGIDWSQTHLISFLADSTTELETKMPKLNGRIYFNAGQKEFFMIYDEVIWFEELGWYGVDIGRIDEKSKENDPEEIERNLDDDSAMMAVDSVIAMPDTSINVKEIKPVKKTPPVKPTGKPVKGKLQSAAKKPE
jgi:hypothetical protein